MRQNIRLLYLIRFLTSCLPAYVIERLFWEQRGMTVQEVVYAEIVFALTLVVLEIPFGLAIDRYGRKIGMLMGTLFECLSFLLLLHAYSMSSFLFAMVLAGIGTAAISGTEHALLYESMERLGESDCYERTIGRMNAVGLAAIGGAALVGAWLAKSENLMVHYHLSIGCLIAAVFSSCLLVEPQKPKRLTNQTKRAGLNLLVQRPSFIRIVILSVGFGTTITFVDEFWQLYVRDRGIDVSWFGLILIGMMTAQGIGNLLPKPKSSFFPLIGVLVVYTGGILLLAVAEGGWSLFVLFSLFLIYGWSEPLLATWLQQELTDDYRATGSSTVSFAESLVTMGVGLGFGHLSQVVGLDGAYLYLGLVGLLTAAGLLIGFQKRGA